MDKYIYGEGNGLWYKLQGYVHQSARKRQAERLPCRH